MYTFPKDFVWGTATAAAQIEGGWNLGGKGESIWDRFCTKPGVIFGGHTTHTACDHYHRFPEDIAIMKELGIKNYRLSISWPRIQASGTGPANPDGVAFYRKLLLALRDAGIRPLVTLYHWDLPQALQDKGGWAKRSIITDFEAYAKICFREFGDLVDFWITHNEPAVVVMLGYESGEHAPGLKQPEISLQVAHHLLLSHGIVVKAYREAGGTGQIGITLNMAWMYPASQNPADIQAAEIVHMAGARWYADPVIHGGYPEAVAEYMKKMGRYPEVLDGDFDIIKQKIDFLGINYYMGFECKALPTAENPANLSVSFVASREKTDMGWDICPDGLYELLKRLSKEYSGVDLYITENGAAYDDPILEEDGKACVHDERRIAYLKSHFAAAEKLIKEGVALKGYLVWSLLDNFEWAYGYDKRFGLVHVDYTTLKRTPKDSAFWFASVIRGDKA